MYVHPVDISFNGIHWNKWDSKIKHMGKFYSHCVILEGLRKCEIHPSFPELEDLIDLRDFCEEETKILY